MKKPTNSDAGEAAELLVAADLITRGLEVTKPFNRNGPDDLHVRTEVGWRNVQVKCGRVIKRKIYAQRRTDQKPITSHIIAWVDLKRKRIRYESNRPDPLPEEFR